MAVYPPMPYPPAVPTQRRSSTWPPALPPPLIPEQRRPASELAGRVVPPPGAATPPRLPAPRRRMAAYPPAPGSRQPSGRRQPWPDLPEAAPPRSVETEARGSRLASAIDAIAHVGNAVTLSALLVVAAAVGGLASGQPAADLAPLTITFGP